MRGYNARYEAYRGKEYLGTGTIKEIAKKIGVSPASLYYLRDKTITLIEKPRQYAMYKGENFITIGTIKELARERGIKEKTIRFYLSDVCKRRSAKSNNRIVVIELEEEE